LLHHWEELAAAGAAMTQGGASRAVVAQDGAYVLDRRDT
jgi:hypothetical protein